MHSFKAPTEANLWVPDKDIRNHEEYNKSWTFSSGISPLTDPCFPPYLYLYRPYLDHHKTVLDIGIGKGLQEYGLIEEGYSVRGYDYSEEAIVTLKKQGIPCRKINLNLCGVKTGKISYRHLLKEDLSAPTNVVAIHSIQHIADTAFVSLVFNLMKLSQPETTFFFVTRTFPTFAHSFSRAHTRNYLVSFFGARTDMSIEFLGVIPFCPGRREGKIEPTDGGDQIFIVRKRRVGMFDRPTVPAASTAAPAAPEFKPGRVS